MRKYRKVDPRFWKDEKIIHLSAEEKLIALYLITGQSNRIGIFSFSPGEAIEDLNCLPESFNERFGNVCRTLNFRWDEIMRVLFIPSWWKYNLPENSNVLVGNLKDLDDVPESCLIDLFIKNLEHLPDNLHDTFVRTLTERYPKRFPHGSPIQEQEQEKKQEQEYPLQNGATTLSLVQAKKSKREAAIPAILKPAVNSVIATINKLSGRSFNESSQTTVIHIISRLEEGKSESDLHLVAQHKWSTWGTDDKMRKHFNPITLYRKSHFDVYLAEATSSASPSRKSQIRELQV